MDYTLGTEQDKLERSKRQMLWFGIISLCMSFGGLTSAYIVSMERRDWNTTYEFPSALIISTILIIVSSFTMMMAKRLILKGDRAAGTIWLLATLVFGLTFVFSQVIGFQDLQEQGFYFTGASSNITTTFIFLIAALHIAHVIAGFIALISVIVNNAKGKYTAERHLGLSLGVTFWHFLDILWVFLFGLLYCTRHWCEWFACA
ncbi:MAG: cytochrome c oxidase subunit 3 [Flavobacteriales bacterium]|jgi:cytochrome c oxidase subunit 3